VLTQTDCKPSPLTLLSEEENLFYSTVRQFADDTIAPLVRAMDEEQKISPGLVEKIFDLGIMAIEIPESFGGAGGSFFDSVLAIEAISTVDPAIAVLVDVHNTLVINALRRWATDAQQRLWLPKLASGTVGAYALSESGSGSDAFALQMQAQRIQSGYRLNGGKLWISNAREAGLFVVFAIFVSACVAAVEAVSRLIHQTPPTHLWALAAAGAIGYLGNLVAARVRTRAGHRLNSAALIADGNHAAADAYVSLAVIASAVAVAIGAPIADPIIGLAITLVILRITWQSWRTVRGHDHHD